MMSDSEINQAKIEEERLQLLNDLIRERFGDWATRKDIPIQDNQEVSR
jgi:hypothetical protein